MNSHSRPSHEPPQEHRRDIAARVLAVLSQRTRSRMSINTLQFIAANCGVSAQELNAAIEAEVESKTGLASDKSGTTFSGTAAADTAAIEFYFSRWTCKSDDDNDDASQMTSGRQRGFLASLRDDLTECNKSIAV